MIIINESGLYSLILTSRTDVAKRVKKSATTEVLPSTRKTGALWGGGPHQGAQRPGLNARPPPEVFREGDRVGGGYR